MRRKQGGFLLAEAALAALVLAFLLTAVLRGCGNCLRSIQRSRQLTAAFAACQLYLAAGEELEGWQLRATATAVQGGVLKEVQACDGEQIICNLQRFQ